MIIASEKENLKCVEWYYSLAVSQGIWGEMRLSREKRGSCTHILLVMEYDVMKLSGRKRSLSLTNCWHVWDVMRLPARKGCSHSLAVGYGWCDTADRKIRHCHSLATVGCEIVSRLLGWNNRALPSLTYCQSWNPVWWDCQAGKRASCCSQTVGMNGIEWHCNP